MSAALLREHTSVADARSEKKCFNYGLVSPRRKKKYTRRVYVGGGGNDSCIDSAGPIEDLSYIDRDDDSFLFFSFPPCLLSPAFGKTMLQRENGDGESRGDNPGSRDWNFVNADVSMRCVRSPSLGALCHFASIDRGYTCSGVWA